MEFLMLFLAVSEINVFTFYLVGVLQLTVRAAVWCLSTKVKNCGLLMFTWNFDMLAHIVLTL